MFLYIENFLISVYKFFCGLFRYFLNFKFWVGLFVYVFLGFFRFFSFRYSLYVVWLVDFIGFVFEVLYSFGFFSLGWDGKRWCVKIFSYLE